jgi:hypothetical protein
MQPCPASGRRPLADSIIVASPCAERLRSRPRGEPPLDGAAPLQTYFERDAVTAISAGPPPGGGPSNLLMSFISSPLTVPV